MAEIPKDAQKAFDKH
jgi:hypothetical protein